MCVDFKQNFIHLNSNQLPHKTTLVSLPILEFDNRTFLSYEFHNDMDPLECVILVWKALHRFFGGSMECALNMLRVCPLVRVIGTQF